MVDKIGLESQSTPGIRSLEVRFAARYRVNRDAVIAHVDQAVEAMRTDISMWGPEETVGEERAEIERKRRRSTPTRAR